MNKLSGCSPKEEQQVMMMMIMMVMIQGNDGTGR